jgi:hypothetical protein
MYIKLGTIKANRYYDDPNDFIILSEVPSSSMSFESPTRVRSLDELNIWFGKTYPEYQYLRELIESGTTLYLYKPVCPGSINLSGYSDNYLEDTIPYPSIDYLRENIKGEEKVKYHSNDGIWLYINNSWIRESDYILSEDYTVSFYNRDTLVLSGNSMVCHPKYSENEFTGDEEEFKINYSDSSGVYVSRLEWSGENFKEGEYLGINASGSWTIYYASGYNDIRKKLGTGPVYKKVTGFQSLVEEISRKFDKIVEVSNNTAILYSKDRRDLINMNTFSSISITWEEEEENKLIFSNILDSSSGYVSFWSKTIGKDRDEYNLDESRISISIENVGPDGYVIWISRYGYSEYFIGHIKGTLEEEGIFDRISKESKLVRCEISRNLEELPEGRFYLDGAEIENPTAEWYRKSMDLLVGDTLEDSVSPDFFMIPDLSLYGERQDEQIFLPYATAGNFQYLISETSEEDYKKNYLSDPENRLLYFYGEIKYRMQERPAYYIYLRNLLENNQGLQTKDIIYNSGNNPYIDQEELEEYKCNYLVSNNQVYYYNKYQSGKDYITSGMLRFIMGKVYREVQKRRWEIIGQKFNTLIENKINEIVQSVAIFSNVKSIQITSYLPFPELDLIEVEVEIYTRELLKNNVTLDITINYKKYGN